MSDELAALQAKLQAEKEANRHVALQGFLQHQARMILQLVADAERYRFLRDNAQRSAWEIMLAKQAGSLRNKEQIDAAVDAALETK